MSAKFFSHFRVILEQIESTDRANITKIAKHMKYYPKSVGGYASIEFRDYKKRPIVSIPIKDTNKTVDIEIIYIGSDVPIRHQHSIMITIYTPEVKYFEEYKDEIISEVRKRLSSVGFSDQALSDIELDESSLVFDTAYLHTSEQFTKEFLKAAYYKQSMEDFGGNV